MPRLPPPRDDVLVALGQLIQRRRRDAGVTQAELGIAIGQARRTVSAYESGHVQPPIAALIRIAHTCDLTLSVFLRPLDTVVVPDRKPRCPTTTPTTH